jgi:S-adenosylmethionine hydrolase
LTRLYTGPIFPIVADSSITNLPIITLTTDFGLDDWYVAAMKAVLASNAPAARLIDVTHTIPPGDLVKGSITLERAISSCPPGTIHLAVVDPGVGSSRRPIIAAIADQLVVCPDNGLITWAWHCIGAGQIHEITWRSQKTSNTFHGRDLFAPVAAMLASGKSLATVAKPASDPILLPLEPATTGTGRIIHIDRFGNCTTNIRSSLVVPGATIQVRDHKLPLRRTYSDMPSGQFLALINSSDLLEIAVRDDSAANTMPLSVGDVVTVLMR